MTIESRINEGQLVDDFELFCLRARASTGDREAQSELGAAEAALLELHAQEDAIRVELTVTRATCKRCGAKSELSHGPDVIFSRRRDGSLTWKPIRGDEPIFADLPRSVRYVIAEPRQCVACFEARP